MRIVPGILDQCISINSYVHGKLNLLLRLLCKNIETKVQDKNLAQTERNKDQTNNEQTNELKTSVREEV
jgi:hypothetical protein